jgi:hypothetical protein
MVEEPVVAAPGVPADAGLLTTPSGKQYTAAQLHTRSDATTTPGGTHTAAFFTSQHLADRREQMQLQLRQQDAGSNPPPLLQQLLGVSQQQQQTLELLMSRLQGTEQSPAAAGTASNEDLWQALQATQQQVRDMRQALQQQQQQSAANLQVQQLGARSSHYTSRMGGGVDPIAEVSMPYISSNPQLQAVLGAANSSSLLPHSSDSGNLAGAILAALDMREARLVRAVVAALQGSPGSSNPAMAAAAAAAAGGSASATDAVLPMGRLESVGGVATVNAAAAATAAGAAAAGAAAAGVAAAAGSKPKEKFFPDLSSHASLAELAEWYYVQSYRNTGKTPQQLEVDGRSDKQQWRGGHRHRIQRWNEYVQLLRVIEQQRSAMQDERRRSSHNAHCVATVDEVSAARELDRQRERLGLSVCEYRQYIAPEPSSKGYKKAKAKEQQLLEAAGGEAAAETAAAAKRAAVVAAAAAEDASKGAADTQAGDAAPVSPPLGVVQQQEQHRQTSARGQQRGRGSRGRGRAH